MNKFMKYYSVVTATVSILLFIYLNYYLFNLYDELIDLLNSNEEIIINAEQDNLPKDENINLLSPELMLFICITGIFISVYYFTSGANDTSVIDNSLNELYSIIDELIEKGIENVNNINALQEQIYLDYLDLENYFKKKLFKIIKKKIF
jgi:ABC-type multidrug transport system permease subunit